jgi:hypothetical protein
MVVILLSFLQLSGLQRASQPAFPQRQPSGRHRLWLSRPGFSFLLGGLLRLLSSPASSAAFWAAASSAAFLAASALALSAASLAGISISGFTTGFENWREDGAANHDDRLLGARNATLNEDVALLGLLSMMVRFSMVACSGPQWPDMVLPGMTRLLVRPLLAKEPI